MAKTLGLMTEEEKKATESTQGFIAIVSRYDVSEDKMAVMKMRQRQELVAFREMMLLPRGTEGE